VKGSGDEDLSLEEQGSYQTELEKKELHITYVDNMLLEVTFRAFFAAGN